MPRDQNSVTFNSKPRQRLSDRIIFRCGLLFLLAASPVFSADPLDAISQLASALSQNDSVNALAVFDSKMPDYGSIESDIGALVAQADILCAIDILGEKDVPVGNESPEKELSVDWFLQLKSQSPSGPTERRREQVTLRMKNIKGKWKITKILPLKILAPITIP
jgi:hypothetical protein